MRGKTLIANRSSDWRASSVVAGASGAILGLAMLSETHTELAADNHFRYLSGLLLGIGLAFWSTIPHIEIHTARFRLLTFIVVIGGLSRLYGMMVEVPSSISMFAALVMELIVTPLLYLGQTRVARKRG